MANVVKSWGLNEEISARITEIIQENAIDDDNISRLTPELIKELFPQIGLRLHFFDKWMVTYGQHKKSHLNEESETDSVDSDLNKISKNEKDDDETALKKEDAFLCKTAVAARTQNINIKSMLNRTIQGQAILQSYKKTKTLSRKYRNIIVDLILSEILLKTNRLTKQDIDYLAQAIVKVFPTESTYTYYIPPIAKRYSRTQKSIVSRGKLVDKYRNKIREFKTLSGSDTSLDKPSSSFSANASSDDENTEAIAEAISWLQMHTEPWEVVLAKWKFTTECRRKDNNLQKTLKVCEIFERWPILKHPKGYDLIEVDYASLKLTTVELSIENWSAFYTNLLKIRPLRKDDSYAESLNQLLQIDNLTDDTKIFLQLRMLPHIIPPKGRTRVKKNHWKPSISECKDSIIVHAVLSADTTTIQEKRREAMKKLGMTVQPFIIAVGLTLSEIDSFYVCIDQVLYKVPSALKALEVCFKSFHVLDAEYPPESEHLWLLLQRSLFKFATKWDKMTPYIMEIVSELSTLDVQNIEQRKE